VVYIWEVEGGGGGGGVWEMCGKTKRVLEVKVGERVCHLGSSKASVP
jgi:hypothetical protein